MEDKLHKIPEYLPFISLVNGTHTPLVTRLVEAAILGGVITWGTVQVLGERIDNLAQTQREIKYEIKQIRDDFYKPMIPE